MIKPFLGINSCFTPVLSLYPLTWVRFFDLKTILIAIRPLTDADDEADYARKQAIADLEGSNVEQYNRMDCQLDVPL